MWNTAKLLQMDFSGGLLIIIVLLFRTLGKKKYSANIFVLLWLVILLRLLIPLELPVRVMSEGLPSLAQMENPNVMWLTNQLTGEYGLSTAYETGSGMKTNEWLILAWFNGMIIVLLHFIITYLRQCSKLQEAIAVSPSDYLEEWKARHSLKRQIGIFYYDRTNTPLTYGLLHPRIILPNWFEMKDKTALEFVLEHEYVHIWHMDCMWKMLMALAAAVHWYNPLVWAMYFCFDRDLELACDERVTDHMSREQRMDYARILLYFASKNRKNTSAGLCFGKNPVKERIEMLMKKKKAKLGMLSGLFFLLCTITAFAKPYVGEQNNGLSEAAATAQSSRYPEYEAAGLRYDSRSDHLYYNNQTVGYLIDKSAAGQVFEMKDAAGTIALEALRDGQGNLTAFQKLKNNEYLETITPEERRKAQNSIYADYYASYGVTCDETTGELQYKGRIVNVIYDNSEHGTGISIFGSSPDNTICIQVKRNQNDEIETLEELTIEQMSELLDRTIDVYWTADGWKGRG